MPNFARVKAVYQPFRGFEKQLEEELGLELFSWGELLLSYKPAKACLWAQNIWYEPKVLEFASIGEAAKKLTSLGPLWVPYIHELARRSKLIAQKLPYVSTKRLEFGKALPSRKLGSFALLGQNLMLASANCLSERAGGEWEFLEDKALPPSRAYLKLWEVFSRFNIAPSKDASVLEIGAAPGGWAWVLAKYCQSLTTIDRSPLADNVASLPNIGHHIKDAFKAKPEEYPDVDWIFSDIIAYPPKLLEWLKPWFNDEKKRNYVCTIKLQDRKHYETVQEFAQIAGANVVHLYHNKHELTFILLENRAKVRTLWDI